MSALKNVHRREHTRLSPALKCSSQLCVRHWLVNRRFTPPHVEQPAPILRLPKFIYYSYFLLICRTTKPTIPKPVINHGFMIPGKRLAIGWNCFIQYRELTAIPANTQLDHERIASLNLNNSIDYSLYDN